MKFISSISLVITGILLSGCADGRVPANQDSPYSDYETTTFAYVVDVTQPRVKLCDVNYYVNGDTLFSSEKYRALSLYYSKDDENSLSYLYMVIFDIKQSPNDDGWYFLTLSDKEIPRIPDIHLSAVIMRNYCGELEEVLEPNHTWPDAVIYNNSKEVAHRQDRNVMMPQLQKLYPYIK